MFTLNAAEAGKSFAAIKLSNARFMEVLNTPNFFAERVNELSFLVGIIITVVFYFEYKKCVAEIEKQDMLDHFLND